VTLGLGLSPPVTEVVRIELAGDQGDVRVRVRVDRRETCSYPQFNSGSPELGESQGSGESLRLHPVSGESLKLSRKMGEGFRGESFDMKEL